MVIQPDKMSSSFGEVKPVGPDKRVSKSILSLVKVSLTTLYTVYKKAALVEEEVKEKKKKKKRATTNHDSKKISKPFIQINMYKVAKAEGSGLTIKIS